jgi:hypothetical protein
VVGDICETPRRRDAPGDCAPGAYVGAVYSVDRDRWREIELPDEVGDTLNGQHLGVGATSDGRAVFVLGERGAFGVVPGRQLWTYSVADDEWARVDNPDLLIEDVCLADDHLVTAAGLIQTAGAGEGTTTAAGGPSLRVLDLAAEQQVWFPAPAVEVTSVAPSSNITCGDDTVLLDTGDAAGLRLFTIGAGGGWRALEAMPTEEHHLARVWTGDEYLFLDPEVENLAYAPDDDEWRTLDDHADLGPEPLWADDAAVGWPEPSDQPTVFEP